ncbi:MAG: PAS domain S-box protein [Candidatus Peregrinibacteria bacterium]
MIKPQKPDPKIDDFVYSINILKTMNECFWMGDKNHKTIYVNPIFEKISEYSLKECIGRDCVSFFDEEGKKTINNQHRLRKSGRSSQYEATMISKNGKKIPLLISGSPTKSGGTMGIFTNLTRLKNLARQERLSEHIIKNSTEAIVVLNKKSRITMWSIGAAKMFGYKEPEILNKKLANLVIPEDEQIQNKNLIDQVEKRKFIKNVETKRITKSGKIIDVIISVTRVTDEKDEFIGYLVIYRDITDKKKTSTELQKRFETIQDAYKELGLQRRQNDYIYELIDSAASDNSLENLTKLIVSAACMLTKCDGSVLRFYNSETDRLKLQACIGVDTKWLSKDSILFGNSVAQEACGNKRPIIIQDISRSDKHQSIKLAEAHGFKTLIVIPLIVGSKILGSLSLYATDPSKFRLIETDFLEKFGKQCSLAIFAKANNLFEPHRNHKKIKQKSKTGIKTLN